MTTARKLHMARLVCALITAVSLASAFQTAEARSQYRVQFLKHYPQVKEQNSEAITCLICHAPREDNDRLPDHKRHNNYGAALKAVIGKNERNVDTILQAFRAVESKDSAIPGTMFGDLLKAGKLPAGVNTEPDEARAVVERAIQALGGQGALARSKASTWKEQGTFFGMGDGVPYAGEYAHQWPDRFKMTIEGVFTIVLNGDQGWMATGGTVRELAGDELAEQQEQNHSRSVASLLFAEEQGYTLKQLDDAEVDGQPASVVKVSREGRREVTLCFNRTSGLPVKAEYRLKSSEQGGKEVTEEVFLSDYREVNGLQTATKLVARRDGQKFIEAQLSDIQIAEELDPALFAKPE